MPECSEFAPHCAQNGVFDGAGGVAPPDIMLLLLLLPHPASTRLSAAAKAILAMRTIDDMIPDLDGRAQFRWLDFPAK
jgi:hypothetical protein